MTIQTRSTLKGVFETGDTPDGTNYADLIDSALNLADTTAQSVSSPVTITGALGATTSVSAVSVEASAATFTTVLTGTLSAQSAIVSALSVLANVTANEVFASAMHATRMSAANVSANALGITGSLTWTAEVTASVVSTGEQTIDGLVVNKFIIVNVSGQTVGIPCFKVA